MTRARRLLVAGCAAALALPACRNFDVVTASYRTLADASAAGAIERGWVPEGLPEGTYELREAHDLDTNRRWGLLNFPLNEADTLRNLLEDSETSLEGLRCDIPSRIEWWPVLLRGRLDPERIRTTGLRAYRARSGDLLFVVQWEQGRAYYWSVDSSAFAKATAGRPSQATEARRLDGSPRIGPRARSGLPRRSS